MCILQDETGYNLIDTYPRFTATVPFDVTRLGPVSVSVLLSVTVVSVALGHAMVIGGYA